MHVPVGGVVGGVSGVVGGGVDGKPVEIEKVGVGDFVGVLVGDGVGFLAVLWPPVIIWWVAIGRFGLFAR